MEAININWNEAFSYFISDIEHYHPASTERLGGIIQSVLKHHQPSEVTESPLVSWCTLLRGLMRILRCQLGCNILPSDNTDYAWLDMPYAQQNKPFVDWLHLEVETTDAPEEMIDDLVWFLATKAYGPIESTQKITPGQAWCSNPFLVDFQNAHRMQPWSVPIPPAALRSNAAGLSDVDGMLQEIVPARDVAQTYPHRHVPWSNVQFTVTLNHIALAFSPEEPSFDREGINGLKHVYIALLRWMKNHWRYKKSDPLFEFVKTALKEWTFEKDDTMSTNNKMWFELRTFQELYNARKGTGASRNGNLGTTST